MPVLIPEPILIQCYPSKHLQTNIDNIKSSIQLKKKISESNYENTIGKTLYFNPYMQK